MTNDIETVLSKISVQRIKEYLLSVEGLRHGWENYDSLEDKARFIEKTLSSFELNVRNQYLHFHGRTYRNIIATLDGKVKEKKVLLGAHYDAAWGSPGADDNASGIAVMLEAANVLKEQALQRSIEFVAFTLEEPQPQTIHFLIGSNHFARVAKKSRKQYKAVIILESVGYTDSAEGSQVIPLFVKIRVPKTGNFLGIIANRKSKDLMITIMTAGQHYIPDLSMVPYKVPLSGRFIPETRFSDHASFWNYGYPALMLTDTAMFRNPHYHTQHDRHNTLDFQFIENVTKTVVSSMLMLCSE